MQQVRVLILLILLFAVNGCAHTWSPKQVPDISLESVAPFSEQYSVSLVNNQPNTTPQIFAGVMGHTHYANYNEWTQFYVEAFAKELEKRGVKVGSDSPNIIKIALSNFVFIQGFAKVRVNMMVKLESGDGKWQKVYEETDTSGWNMGRAFGSVIYHSIEKLMRDQEVLRMMRPSQVVASPAETSGTPVQVVQ